MVFKVELYCYIEGVVLLSLVKWFVVNYCIDVLSVIDGNGKYVWLDFFMFLKVYDMVSFVFKILVDYVFLVEIYFWMLVVEGVIYGEIFIFFDYVWVVGLFYWFYVEGFVVGIEWVKNEIVIEGCMIVIGVCYFGVVLVECVVKEVVGNFYLLVSGFGLVGDECLGYLVNFVKVFCMVVDVGLGIIVYVGEFGGLESVIVVFEFLWVKWLGYGVCVIEDFDLVKCLVDEGVVLEVCLGFNIVFGVYMVLWFYLVYMLCCEGVKIIFNFDDLFFFGIIFGKEYVLIVDMFGWFWVDLMDVIWIVIEVVFCDEVMCKWFFVCLDSVNIGD